jgi:hypothetical protein
MRQYIGAVIAGRNIFTPLYLFIQTSPNNLAVASRNGNRFFTQKLYVQFANKLHRHNAGLKFSYCLRFDLPNFSLPSTFKCFLTSVCQLFLLKNKNEQKPVTKMPMPM